MGASSKQGDCISGQNSRRFSFWKPCPNIMLRCFGRKSPRWTVYQSERWLALLGKWIYLLLAMESKSLTCRALQNVSSIIDIRITAFALETILLWATLDYSTPVTLTMEITLSILVHQHMPYTWSWWAQLYDRLSFAHAPRLKQRVYFIPSCCPLPTL